MGMAAHLPRNSRPHEADMTPLSAGLAAIGIAVTVAWVSKAIGMSSVSPGITLALAIWAGVVAAK